MNFSRFLDVVVAYLNPKKVSEHRVEAPVSILDTDTVRRAGVSESINQLPTVVIETRVDGGLRWDCEQSASCSWTSPPLAAVWTANQSQYCRWIPGYINFWVCLNDQSCVWTGSLGAYIVSGWVLEARQFCEWEVVNTNPGRWTCQQEQLCEWVPTVQAVPEPCLSGDGLPEGRSRGRNYAF